MKKNEIVKGGIYRAPVSGNLTNVRVDAIREVSRLPRRPRVYSTAYDVTNLQTGRKTTFARPRSSAARPAIRTRKPKRLRA